MMSRLHPSFQIIILHLQNHNMLVTESTYLSLQNFQLDYEKNQKLLI